MIPAYKRAFDDDEYWIAGMFYCNPSDKRVNVEKRAGFGATINIGHPVGKFIGIPMLQSVPGIVFAYLGFGGAMTVFILNGFIKGVPFDLEEAASIDGCTPEQTFFQIIFPLLTPVITTVTILNGMWIWNDYLLPSMMLGQNGKVMTIPIAIQKFVGSYVKRWDRILPAALLAIVPMIIIFLIAQKEIMEGMIEGAVKG